MDKFVALKKVIILKKRSLSNLAKELNICRQTLYKKLNGKVSFTLDEINKISSILSVDKTIFFNS